MKKVLMQDNIEQVRQLVMMYDIYKLYMYLCRLLLLNLDLKQKKHWKLS
jgi:hypothetical protein